jgi:hypothetical protein
MVSRWMELGLVAFSGKGDPKELLITRKGKWAIKQYTRHLRRAI